MLSALLGDSATEDAILVLATSELQGICDAFSQQATRLVAHCVLTRSRPTKAAQGIRQLVATVGLQRSRMMADYLIVKAHAAATLEAFREAGVTHVGTVAEMVPHVHLGDAGPEDEQRNERGEWTSGSAAMDPESRLARAKEQGFTLQAYHGSLNPDIEAFEARQPALGAGGVYVATKPEHANAFARDYITGKGSVYPVLVRGKIAPRAHVEPMYGKFSAPEMVAHLKGEGYAGFYEDREHSGLVVFDPKNVRSSFAEFHPDKQESSRLLDAARKTPQHQHPTTGKFITKAAATREWGRRGSGKFGKAPKTYNRSIAHRKALRAAKALGEEEVNIQTAGDDRVCATCQAISANGPYPIDEAMDLIPNHPRCRCVYVPAGVGIEPQRTP